MSKLDKLEIGIELRKGAYTSYAYGKLTPEAKQQIKDLFFGTDRQL